MRDVHRGSDRLYFSLDVKQVAGIVGGALGTLAIVFALGVAFGRQLATAPSTAGIAGDLAQLDARANEPPPEPPSGADFVFHDALTRNDPRPAARPSEPKRASPSPTPAAAKPKASPEPVVLVAPPEPTPTPEPVAVVEPPPEPSSVPAPPAPAPVAVAKPSPPPAPKEAKEATDALWTVQFGSSQQREEADRLAALLRDLGYKPFVTVVDLADRGRFHRVRVGRFADRAEAERLREQVSASHKLNGLVMSLR